MLRLIMQDLLQRFVLLETKLTDKVLLFKIVTAQIILFVQAGKSVLQQPFRLLIEIQLTATTLAIILQ